MDSDKKALLVGINKYYDSRVRSLRYSVNDVSALGALLTEPERGGFTSDSCMTLTDKNSESEPSRSNIMSALKSLSQTARPNDYVLFFFSGHGIEEEGKSYLLPSDAKLNVLCDTAMSIDWIRSTLAASKARAKVLIFDACHAGAMKGKTESGRMTKGLQDALLSPMEGFAILSSCKMHEVSYEMPDKKQSVFTYFLMEGLKGAADYDSDGQITVSDASRYTAEKTLQWSYKQRVEQTPNLECHVVGDLILTYVPHVGDEIKQKIRVPVKRFPALDLPLHSITLNFEISSKETLESRYEKYCVYLLKHFSIDEIDFAVDRGHPEEYVFPMGGLTNFSLRLKYAPASLSTIEDLFLKAAEVFSIRSATCFCKKQFDKTKISKWLKEKKLRATYYDPKEYLDQLGRSSSRKADMVGRQKPFLVTLLDLPGTKQKFMMIFYGSVPGEGKSGCSAFVISDKDRSFLTKESAQVLKPTTLFSFMGDVWQS